MKSGRLEMTVQSRRFAWSLLLSFFLGGTLHAEMKNARHPFLLWTREELVEIRQRVRSDPQAQKQVDQMLQLETRGPKSGGNPSMLNLFKFAVLDDKDAGRIEKDALLQFIGTTVPGSKAGNPNTLNAPWREDHTLDALRYDVLYDELTDGQRRQIEQTARSFIDWCVANPGPWEIGDPGKGLKPGVRCGWLPNMQWPTMAGAHVLAAAIKDEVEIRKVFGCNGGWKWYFDNYIADGRFYMEEFAKYSSNIGSMILWCNALDRLGLNQYGWGYTGAGGATMRRFLGCLIDASLPEIPRGDGAWNIPVIWMGDAGRTWVVQGDSLTNSRWSQARMQGAIGKMLQPLWWEAGQQRFPEAGFDYFVAQYHAPGETVVLPTLYFGLRPIDSTRVKAPPAASYITADRGFAMLRSEESPAYWKSPKPAVALQFGMRYVHYIHDCFSILDFVAYNRLIYDKVGNFGTHGYAGGDFWRDHGRGQASAVVVDDLQVQPVDSGEEGCKNERIRSRLDGPAKFAAVRAKGAFEPSAGDVDLERALVLTADYLVDATWLVGEREHVYDWHVQSRGAIPAIQNSGWRPVAEFSDGKIRQQSLAREHLGGARAQDARADTWNATILLQPTEAPANDPDAIGVSVRMLGEEGTVLISGRPPGLDANLGVKLMATRTARRTCFVAVHEPLKGGVQASRIEQFRRFGKPSDGLAIKIVGKTGTGIDDRVLLLNGNRVGAAATFADEGESFTLSDQAWLRISSDRVDVWGDLKSIRLKVTGIPHLIVNGAEKPVKIANGVLFWSSEL